jgi:metal-dependent HD superfamily phosphatase/phosphodiesterase
MATYEVLAFAAIIHEIIHFAHRTVENRHGKPFALHVQDEVLPHYSQTYEPDVRFFCFRHFSSLLMLIYYFD